ncbi:MAG: helix-turn-helix domain-containing protein [Anaerovoracaceae bacterium]|jgi:hypothetical protein
MPAIPDAYRHTICDFLDAYWFRRGWEIRETVAGVELPHVAPDVLHTNLLAQQLSDIARMAAGDWPDSQQARDVVMESIQDLMERLFAAPGMPTAYRIPREFWSTPLGQMVAHAMARVRGDDLITITEAAAILGVGVSAISNRITAGDLIAIPDPNEPNPQKRNRVLRSEVEALRE